MQPSDKHADDTAKRLQPNTDRSFEEQNRVVLKTIDGHVRRAAKGQGIMIKVVWKVYHLLALQNGNRWLQH